LAGILAVRAARRKGRAFFENDSALLTVMTGLAVLEVFNWAKYLFSPKLWLSRRIVHSKDQAELNNFCAAIFMSEEDAERHELLINMKTFFSERPGLLKRNRDNRKFYDEFLAPLSSGQIEIDPARWQALVKAARRLKG
jgi:hypothetical protein